MLEPVSVDINGRAYTVNPFPPIEAFEFFHDLTDAQASGRGTGKMARRAIGQCLDPMMNSLGNNKNFTDCFSEHPEDMIPLEKAAMEALTAPFTKGLSGTTETGSD